MKALFQNPKAALAYVGITLMSVVLFVGTEDEPGKLQQTVSVFGEDQSAKDMAERRFGDPQPAAGARAEDGRGPSTREDEVIIEFASDEELIDQARGFDPAPSGDVSGYDPNPSSERPLLSEQDKVRPEDEMGGWSE